MHDAQWFTIDYVDGWSDYFPVLEHKHDTYELDLFIKANIRIFVRDRQYDIGDGDVLLISPYDIHRIVYASGRYERYVLNFSKEPLQRYLSAIGAGHLLEELERTKDRSSRKLEVPLKDRLMWEGLFRSLLASASKTGAPAVDQELGEIHGQEASLTIALLLVKLFQHIHHSAGKEAQASRKEQQVRNMIQLLDKRFAEPVTLQQLEKAFHLNKYYISHLFKEITGFTVVEYLQHRRIQEAQRLLRSSDKPVSDVCFDCGFTNIQHFHSVFKKVTKSTPHQYRKSDSS